MVEPTDWPSPEYPPLKFDNPPPRAPVEASNTAFFYGTLMSPGVLYRVIYGDPKPRLSDNPSMTFLKFSSGILQDHRRHKVVGADYPAILPEKGGCVRGTIVSGLTEGDMWRLDIFEGTQYERQRVLVQVLKDVKLDEAAPEAKGVNGAAPEAKDVKDEAPVDAAPESTTTDYVLAHTYLWFSAVSELDPSEWDFEEFKREKMDDWMGTSSNGWAQKDEGFDDVDKAVAARDGMGGRGVNGHIGRELAEALKGDWTKGAQ